MSRARLLTALVALIAIGVVGLVVYLESANATFRGRGDDHHLFDRL